MLKGVDSYDYPDSDWIGDPQSRTLYKQINNFILYILKNDVVNLKRILHQSLFTKFI
jgi:hypothetical protein